MFFILTNESYSAFFNELSFFSKQLPIVFDEAADGKASRRNLDVGLYRLDAYFAAISTVTLPMSVFFPFLFVVISYYLVGFLPEFYRFLGFLGIVILASNTAATIGHFIGTATGNFVISSSLTTIVLLPFILLGGFYSRGYNILWIFRWIRYISLFNWAYKLLILNQFHGIRIECPPDPELCRYPSDEAILEAFSTNESDVAIAIPVLLIINICFRILSFICFELRGYFHLMGHSI